MRLMGKDESHARKPNYLLGSYKALRAQREDVLRAQHKYSKTLAAVQQRIIDGETTGTPRRDVCIVAFGGDESYMPKLEDLERRIADHQGEPLLIYDVSNAEVVNNEKQSTSGMRSVRETYTLGIIGGKVEYTHHRSSEDYDLFAPTVAQFSVGEQPLGTFVLPMPPSVVSPAQPQEVLDALDVPFSRLILPVSKLAVWKKEGDDINTYDGPLRITSCYFLSLINPVLDQQNGLLLGREAVELFFCIRENERHNLLDPELFERVKGEVHSAHDKTYPRAMEQLGVSASDTFLAGVERRKCHYKGN